MIDDYRLVPLTKGQFAMVSPTKFEELIKFSWQAMWSASTKTFYAIRRDKLIDGGHAVLMHRQLLGLTYGDKRTGDHIDHDTLNNVDSNLWIATRSAQIINQRTKHNNPTGFKGIARDKRNGVYRAWIHVDGHTIHLGSRTTAEAAYRELYVPAALKYHGEFACL